MILIHIAYILFYIKYVSIGLLVHKPIFKYLILNLPWNRPLNRLTSEDKLKRLDKVWKKSITDLVGSWV